MMRLTDSIHFVDWQTKGISQRSILRTVSEALPLNVIKHLGGIGKQAATSHACHRPLLCVRTKMFF